MSYHELTEEGEEYVPKALAEELNMHEVERIKGADVDILVSVAQAFDGVQQLSGDDTTKWEVLESLVQAMNYVNPKATIRIEEDRLGVKMPNE